MLGLIALGIPKNMSGKNAINNKTNNDTKKYGNTPLKDSSIDKLAIEPAIKRHSPYGGIILITKILYKNIC